MYYIQPQLLSVIIIVETSITFMVLASKSFQFFEFGIFLVCFNAYQEPCYQKSLNAGGSSLLGHTHVFNGPHHFRKKQVFKLIAFYEKEHETNIFTLTNINYNQKEFFYQNGAENLEISFFWEIGRCCKMCLRKQNPDNGRPHQTFLKSFQVSKASCKVSGCLGIYFRGQGTFAPPAKMQGYDDPSQNRVKEDDKNYNTQSIFIIFD